MARPFPAGWCGRPSRLGRACLRDSRPGHCIACRSAVPPHRSAHRRGERIAVGLASPGVLYVQTDSGDDARFFARDARTGRTLVYVITKSRTGVSRVYAVPTRPDTSRVQEQKRIAAMCFGVTGDQDCPGARRVAGPAAGRGHRVRRHQAADRLRTSRFGGIRGPGRGQPSRAGHAIWPASFSDGPGLWRAPLESAGARGNEWAGSGSGSGGRTRGAVRHQARSRAGRPTAVGQDQTV